VTVGENLPARHFVVLSIASERAGPAGDAPTETPTRFGCTAVLVEVSATVRGAKRRAHSRVGGRQRQAAHVLDRLPADVLGVARRSTEQVQRALAARDGGGRQPPRSDEIAVGEAQTRTRPPMRCSTSAFEWRSSKRPRGVARKTRHSPVTVATQRARCRQRASARVRRRQPLARAVNNMAAGEGRCATPMPRAPCRLPGWSARRRWPTARRWPNSASRPRGVRQV